MIGLLIVTEPDTGKEWEIPNVDDDEIDRAITVAFGTAGAPAATLDVCGDHGYIGVWRWDGEDAWSARYCPTCDAKRPELHPAMQAEGGEVQLCPDPWHRHLTAENTVTTVAKLRSGLATYYPDRSGWWLR